MCRPYGDWCSARTRSHRSPWIIHERAKCFGDAVKCGHYRQSYTDAFDTVSLSLSAANWPETRVQTVFPAIDLQNS